MSKWNLPTSWDQTDGDKAIVKKTGETNHIKSSYTVTHVTMSFDFDVTDDTNEFKEMIFTHDSGKIEDGHYYILSDGKTYHERDVIVGDDEIRDYKIKNII